MVQRLSCPERPVRGRRSLTELHTTTPGGPAAVLVFAAMAEFERNLIGERARPNALSRP